LKIQETRSSETSRDFERTTRGYVREYRILHDHRCENLKSHSLCIFSHAETWIVIK
jgi:hypothetical protein